MTIKSSTVPAPVMPGYDPPQQGAQRQRMLEEMRKLMPVSKDGFDRPRRSTDDSVTAIVTAPTAAPPSFATALSQAAEAVGADLPTLLDSQAFVTAITPVSSRDQALLQAVIRDHMPAPVAPLMAPNPAQGHTSGAAVPTAPKNLFERLKLENEKALSAPPPPSAQPYGSRTKGDQST